MNINIIILVCNALKSITEAIFGFNSILSDNVNMIRVPMSTLNSSRFFYALGYGVQVYAVYV